MQKIEHIGIAVKNIEKSNDLFARIFGKRAYQSEIVEKEGVITSFFQIGESKIELVSAINNKSTIFKYLQKNKEGMHHIAFCVEDIAQEIARIKNEGIRVLNEVPKKGADNQLVCFLHPRDTNGVLIEICQKIS